MKKILFLILFVNLSNSVVAQFIKEKQLNVSIGYGMSSPYYSDSDIVDTGFFMQGELILKSSSWFEIRPYLGFIITNSKGKDLDDNPTEELAECRSVLLGGKARLRAPIPWVAPYVELGIGASIGSFNTETNYSAINKSGLLYHIPVSVGLEIGRKGNFDLGYAFYFHPTAEQFAGAFALGVTFPLNW